MWDPEQYGRFADHRLRPARELLARVPLTRPDLVVDLGTGRGEMARIMAERWPGATVVGLDRSPEMLAAAGSVPSRVRWVEADLSTWRPRAPVDLIYANAVLHWVGGHEELFPRLVGFLAPGGVLAVQMPLTWGEPSHVLMRRVLEDENLGSRELRTGLASPPVRPPGVYRTLLAPHTSRLDLWQTRDELELSGPDPVLEWVMGAALRPVLDELDPRAIRRFLARYRVLLAEAYPPTADGVTRYPFPRLFIVAVRSPGRRGEGLAER